MKPTEAQLAARMANLQKARAAATARRRAVEAQPVVETAQPIVEALQPLQPLAAVDGVEALVETLNRLIQVLERLATTLEANSAPADTGEPVEVLRQEEARVGVQHVSSPNTSRPAPIPAPKPTSSQRASGGRFQKTQQSKQSPAAPKTGYYHPQPCFCLNCKALRADGEL